MKDWMASVRTWENADSSQKQRKRREESQRFPLEIHQNPREEIVQVAADLLPLRGQSQQGTKALCFQQIGI